jgi:hypothetical protein
MFTEEQKQKYKKWVDNGRPLYHIDKSKEPTAEENRIFHEMDKQQGKTYTVKAHDEGRTYTVIDHQQQEPPKPKQPEKSTNELIAELKALQRKPNVTPKLTKKDQELERSRKEWDKCFKDNQGKIKGDFPKTIFDAIDNY